MAATTFGKQQWVEMFQQIGLDEPTMRNWHVVFEQRWPETHQSFLQWLQVAPPEIDEIREASRGPWARG